VDTVMNTETEVLLMVLWRALYSRDVTPRRQALTDVSGELSASIFCVEE
jgi:hypothetical protein